MKFEMNLFADNSVTLEVGQKITVRVPYQDNNTWIDFDACNANSCAEVTAFGTYPNGTLDFNGNVRCNTRGMECTKYSEVSKTILQFYFNPPIVLKRYLRATTTDVDVRSVCRGT